MDEETVRRIDTRLAWLDLSRGHLADAIGLDRGYMSRTLSSEAMPPIFVSKIADGLGLRVEELKDLEDLKVLTSRHPALRDNEVATVDVIRDWYLAVNGAMSYAAVSRHKSGWGRRVATRLAWLGMSQTDLAESIRMNPSQLSRLLRKEVEDISDDVVTRVAGAIGMYSETLCDESDLLALTRPSCSMKS